MADCKLGPGTADCRFKATPGSVTLSVQGTTGTILFQQAAYKGNPIAGLPASTLTFTIEVGIGDLDVVYSFSAPATGAGVMREVCTNNTPLALVSAQEPFQRYRICTERPPIDGPTIP